MAKNRLNNDIFQNFTDNTEPNCLNCTNITIFCVILILSIGIGSGLSIILISKFACDVFIASSIGAIIGAGLFGAAIYQEFHKQIHNNNHNNNIEQSDDFSNAATNGDLSDKQEQKHKIIGFLNHQTGSTRFKTVTTKNFDEDDRLHFSNKNSSQSYKLGNLLPHIKEQDSQEAEQDLQDNQSLLEYDYQEGNTKSIPDIEIIIGSGLQHNQNIDPCDKIE